MVLFRDSRRGLPDFSGPRSDFFRINGRLALFDEQLLPFRPGIREVIDGLNLPLL